MRLFPMFPGITCFMEQLRTWAWAFYNAILRARNPAEMKKHKKSGPFTTRFQIHYNVLLSNIKPA